MASNKFVFTKEAEIDIDQAIYYIVNELGDKSGAKRLYDKLFNTIQRICEFPYSSERVENKFIKNKNVRRALIDNYLLFYLFDEDKHLIVLLRFIYGKRSITELIKEISL